MLVSGYQWGLVVIEDLPEWVKGGSLLYTSYREKENHLVDFKTGTSIVVVMIKCILLYL